MAISMSKVDTVVCEWQASLYEDTTRKWIYGHLQIYADRVEFISEDKRPFSQTFEELVDVKKSTTGLVFGALYLIKKNNEKVWFSSLADREGVYGSLKHFWKSQLLDNGKSDKKNSMQGQTQKGQKLLSIVKDSEDTLSKAATRLHMQGVQINSTLGEMFDMHNDLDVAEHLIEDLQGWMGRWKIPQKYKDEDALFVNKSEIPDVFEYEVIYTKLETSRANTRSVGILRISKDGLTILTMKMKTEHHFSWTNVSQLHVLTPYEINIIQYRLGKPDLMYGMVSANMVAVLKLLDKCAHHKLKYDNPPKVAVVSVHSHSSTMDRKGQLTTRQSSQSGSRHNPANRIAGVSQIQIDQSDQIVSEKEAEEISRSISGLKSLALSLSDETSVQNETLDHLSVSVDRANQRLSTAEKKVKHMI